MKYVKICRNPEPFFWDSDHAEIDDCPNEWDYNGRAGECPYEHDVYVNMEDEWFKEIEEKAWQYEGLCK